MEASQRQELEIEYNSVKISINISKLEDFSNTTNGQSKIMLKLII
jgi:hypothetical protein